MHPFLKFASKFAENVIRSLFYFPGYIHVVICILLILGTLFYIFQVAHRYLHTVSTMRYCLYFSGYTSLFAYNWYWKPLSLFFRLHIVICILLVLGAIIFIVVDVALRVPRNLMSLVGIAAFILIFYIFSKHPAKVRKLWMTSINLYTLIRLQCHSKRI